MNILKSIVIHTIILSIISVLFSDLSRSDYNKMTGLINHFLAFDQAQLEILHEHPEILGVHKKAVEMIKETAEKSAKDNKEIFLQLLGKIELTQQGKSTADSLLNYVLFMRYKLIAARFDSVIKQNIRNKVQKNREYRDYISTRPEDMKERAEGSVNDYVAQVILTRYQVVSEIIRLAFQNIPKSEIGSATKRALRCSPSIHAYLRQETEDPGYPEQGFSPSSEAELSGDHAFWQYYCEPRLEVEMDEVMLGSPKGKKFRYMMTYEDAIESKLVAQEGSTAALPELDWFVVPQAPAFVDESLVLVKPSFAKEAEDVSENLVLPSLERLNDIHLQVGAQSGSPSEGELTELPDADTLLFDEAFSLCEEQNDCQFEFKFHPFVKVSNFKVSRSASQAVDVGSVSLLTRLKPKEIDWLRDLFRHQHQIVAYADFEKIWKRLNGEKSITATSGGSHRALRNSDGQVVERLFTHGRNQHYPKSYHGYLREAFDKLPPLGANREIKNSQLFQ